MADLFADDPLAQVVQRKQKLPVSVLHQMGCKVCPLAQLPNQNPDMPATGSEHPVVYILGEAPGREEDIVGRQFVGASGRLLRKYIPKKWLDKIRYNNVVRTRPYKNKIENSTPIECCRPSVVRDIEQSKPKVIFGFGNIPLEWVCGWSGITQWRGRRLPVKIGNHTCWYYPMLHPAYLLRGQRTNKRTGEKIPSEEERAFKFDIQRALAEIRILPAPRVHTPQEVFAGIKLITDNMWEVEKAFGWALAQPDVGFDYETDRLRPYNKKSRILSFSFANEETGYAIALDHPEATWSAIQRERILELLRKFFRAKVRKYVHHLAFELEWTGVKFGREFVRTPNWEDTANQASVLDERRGKSKPGNFSLEFLVQQYFGFNLKKLSNVDRKNLAKTPLHTVLMYNGGDARYHCLLGRAQRKLIVEWGLKLPYALKLRRVPTLVLSQMKGVPVDQDEVDRLSAKYEKRIAKLEVLIAKLKVVKQFERIKNIKFNPLSNRDVMFVMKDILKRKDIIITDKKTKKERTSVDESILKKIDLPFCRLILRLRKATKRKSTYIDPYDAMHENSVVHPDGLLHCTFNNWPETNRLSCEDPNLQNVPKRNEEAKEVRKQIAAKKAKRLRFIGAFDYGQIEARLIAVASGDKYYIKTLWEDFDVHTEWAERLARAYPQRIGGRKMLSDAKAMKDFRTDIKNQWTFPLFFGASLSSASRYLTIPEDVLRPEYNRFWKIFTGVRDWQERNQKFYRENGYVETLNGFRRRAPLTHNQVMNSPIQGTAAEIVMDGMCRLSEIGDRDLQAEINIHDDLTFVSLPVDRADELCERIITEMLDIPFPWASKVPWSVEMAVGDNWLELEEVGTFFSHHWFKEKPPAWVMRSAA